LSSQERCYHRLVLTFRVTLSLTISEKWVKGEYSHIRPGLLGKQVRDAYEEINDAQTVHVHGREQWTVLDYENKKRVAQIESREEQLIRYSVIPWRQHFSFLLSYM
jgi:hypothetical protein